MKVKIIPEKGEPYEVDLIVELGETPPEFSDCPHCAKLWGQATLFEGMIKKLQNQIDMYEQLFGQVEEATRMWKESQAVRSQNNGNH